MEFGSLLEVIELWQEPLAFCILGGIKIEKIEKTETYSLGLIVCHVIVFVACCLSIPHAEEITCSHKLFFHLFF